MTDLRDIPGIPSEWMAALDVLIAASLVPAVIQRQAEVRQDPGRKAGEAELAACRQEVVDEYVRTLRAVREARTETPAGPAPAAGPATGTPAAARPRIPAPDIPTTPVPPVPPAPPPIPPSELPETAPPMVAQPAA